MRIMPFMKRKRGIQFAGVGIDSGGGDTSALANKTDLTAIILTGTTNTSGDVISAGTWFYLNGTPCVAKVDIALGATFTEGTNYEEKTVGSALSELNSKIPGFNSLIIDTEPDVSVSGSAWVYTGISFPAAYTAVYCITTFWTHNKPTGIGVATSSDLSTPLLYIDGGSESVDRLPLLVSNITDSTTYYIYGKSAASKFNSAIRVSMLT